MSYRRSIIWLSVFLVVAIMLTWTIINTLRRDISGPTSSYSAVFTDVSGLRAGDDVRMAGVRVGRIDSIELDGNLARVHFRIDSRQDLSGNTKAAVTYQNIIGQRYLGLSLGQFDSPAALEPGGEIPVDHTEPSFDISALLNGFEPLFSVLDPDRVNDLSSSLVGALQGETGAITRLLAQTSSLAESFAGPDALLGDVITDLGQVLTGLSRQTGGIQEVIGRAQEIFEAFAAHREDLVGTADVMTEVGGRLSEIASDTAPSVDAFLTRQPGFLAHFAERKSEFEYLGANVPLLLKGMARVSQEGSFLSAYVCDLNPADFVPFLTPLAPAIVAAATPGGKPKYSPICQP
ncbi:Mce family protein [Gordonia namibiensis NBRC 108229]|uniref:Mce family protein n=1 Tax=Gordonia namibiensis NBRC 108229 TaxID=1208314 RepID=K6X5Q5_9ACTN|nr:MlaD family protein [Gordonia namibiensis]GAC01407.1 Mce family protein [Gordonia namibiensis NBRC 108229]